MSVPRRRGAFPGTFDPPTVAHLAVAEAAVRQCRLDRVDLVVNAAPIDKTRASPLAARRRVLEAVVAPRPWLGLVVTEHVLLADMAQGYDVLVLGADKWAQVVDPAYYGGSASARDAAVARLPPMAIAPRGSLAVPGGCVVLDVDLPSVSSTAARAGARHLVVEEARPFLPTAP